MVEAPVTLSALKIITLLLGLYFLARAYRAYRKHKSRPMLVLFTGVGILTLGVLVEGFLVEVLEWSLTQARLVEATITLLGFAVLVASLHVREMRGNGTNAP